METMTYKIRGMGCEGCEKKVANAVSRLPGVEKATASAEAKSLNVQFSGEPVSNEELKRAVAEAGYEFVG